jgi:hypothetical protein
MNIEWTWSNSRQSIVFRADQSLNLYVYKVLNNIKE